MTAIGETIVIELGDNQCFGCSQQRSDGLGMVFTRTGDRTVECLYTVPYLYRGMGGVVHGGVQAILLDEAVSVAAYLFWGAGTFTVTGNLALSYRRPVPVDSPVLVRGELTSEDERNFHVTGAILDPDGTALTTATALLRKMQRPEEG